MNHSSYLTVLTNAGVANNVYSLTTYNAGPSQIFTASPGVMVGIVIPTVHVNKLRVIKQNIMDVFCKGVPNNSFSGQKPMVCVLWGPMAMDGLKKVWPQSTYIRKKHSSTINPPPFGCFSR